MSENKQQTAAPKNVVASYQTGLVKTQETFISMIIENGQKLALEYNQYQIMCARNCFNRMSDLLWKEGLTIKDTNANNVTEILQTVAMLQINLAATPREGYIILRNVAIKGKEAKEKVFEFGLEGDGNDKLLRTYGVGVKKVHTCWIVREGDDFTYPSFDGLSVVPPKWTPKGSMNKVLRVVYPIQMEDTSVEYHIAERESVKVNLQAHISNNLMWEKDPKKLAVIDEIENLTLDEIFEHKLAMSIASPAWSNHHSREAMIIRKLRNNAIKKIPKDFQSSFVESHYEKTFEDYDQYQKITVDQTKVVETEVEELAGSEKINVQIINESANETVEAEVVEPTVNAQTEGKASKPKNAPF